MPDYTRPTGRTSPRGFRQSRRPTGTRVNGGATRRPTGTRVGGGATRRPIGTRAGGGATSCRHTTRNMTLNLTLLLLTIAIGVIAWMVAGTLYTVFLEAMPRPLLMGLMFASLFGIVTLTVFLYSHLSGNFKGSGQRNGEMGSALLLLFLLGGLTFGAGTLFQWVYQLEFVEEVTEPTSYIFLIDDSGSMETNDSENLRFDAIAEVLADVEENFPFMVYIFSTDVQILAKMQTVADGIPELSGQSYGSTSMRTALLQILEDYQSGEWDGGANPKVILLSDGYPTDTGWFHKISKLLPKYRAAGISISTIGLGFVDENLMEKIATGTGGVYLHVEDATDLASAMSAAAALSADRDLLSARSYMSLGLLYGFLRILFLFILGMIIGLGAAIAYGDFQDSAALIVGTSLIQSLAGAVLVEFGISLTSGAAIYRLLLWILLAMTLAMTEVRLRNPTSSTMLANR